MGQWTAIGFNIMRFKMAFYAASTEIDLLPTKGID